MSELDAGKLLAAASAARTLAYAPYSGFRVGAAVQSASGAIYRGCNVENASYGLTVCAERVAIQTAVAAGEREFVAVAVDAGTDVPTPPCGACRQVIAEFGADLQVVLPGPDAKPISAYLPHGFGPGDLLRKSDG